jgi:transposase
LRTADARLGAIVGRYSFDAGLSHSFLRTGLSRRFPYTVPLTLPVAILAELGDARRFSNSRDAVRYAGLDVTVKQSDQRRAPGHLSRQGPPALRWALYEAAQVARHAGSPDRDYYLKAAERVGGNRACLAIARKLLKRSYHTLRELGEEALAPA